LGASELAAGPVTYLGQGFSLKGDKDRFVLPADVRRVITQASENQDVMMVARHEEWDCLIACGTTYIDQLADEIRAEHEAAVKNGQKSDRARRSLIFGLFQPVSFDKSGRFTLSAQQRQLGSITDSIYFHGAMDYFTIWAPEVLAKQDGPEWIGPRISCAGYAAAPGRGRK
jgi:MraZ protein